MMYFLFKSKVSAEQALLNHSSSEITEKCYLVTRNKPNWDEIVLIHRDCFILIEPRCEKTGLRGFPTRNGAVQPHKMARDLKFLI